MGSVHSLCRRAVATAIMTAKIPPSILSIPDPDPDIGSSGIGIGIGSSLPYSPVHERWTDLFIGSAAVTYSQTGNRPGV
jgi:hypothetical protein